MTLFFHRASILGRQFASRPQLIQRKTPAFTHPATLTTMAEPSSKKARTQPPYELIYWPTIPGRGEFVRLVFEATSTPYTDVANESKEGIKAVMTLIDPESTGDSDGNPPAFAPPALKIPGEGKSGKSLLIYQTPSILSYLGPQLGLAGEDEVEKQWILSHTLTALDLNNEAHDTHHPIASGKYYEEQKEPALLKSADFRQVRLPKFFGFFERILKANEAGQGKFLVGSKLSYADTTLWHVLDGLYFAFPKEMKVREKEFPILLETFYPAIKEQAGIKEYLASTRRLAFSNGIFRHYEELDRQ